MNRKMKSLFLLAIAAYLLLMLQHEPRAATRQQYLEQAVEVQHKVGTAAAVAMVKAWGGLDPKGRGMLVAAMRYVGDRNITLEYRLLMTTWVVQNNTWWEPLYDPAYILKDNDV